MRKRRNELFEKASKKAGPKCALWESIRNLFFSFEAGSMRTIYEAIAFGYEQTWLEARVEETRAESASPA